MYIAFLLAQKRIQSWSQRIQKNWKYKVTTTVTNEEIQHFSVPLESTTCLATIHSYCSMKKFNRLRISAHFFPVETGRMMNKPREHRMCPFRLNKQIRDGTTTFSSALIPNLFQFEPNSLKLFLS